MRINLFSGARRLAMLVGLLFVIGCITTPLFSTPSVDKTYQYTYSFSMQKVVEYCNFDDANSYFSRNTPDGETVWVTLCFAAQKAESGRMLIPFAHIPASPARISMGEGKVLIEPATSLRLLLSDKNSVVVKEYTDGESAKFALPMEISTEVKTLAGKRHFNAKLKQWMYSGITMIVGLIAGWIVIAAIGWVFRGFLGVPAGQDERNSF